MSEAANLKLFPVQTKRHASGKGAIRESVYMAAYEVYSAVYGAQEAMIDIGRGCRGGFSTGELIGFLYARSFPKEQWSRRVDEAFKGMAEL